MHEPLGNLVNAVTALIDVLEPAGIPYAFGGAIALSAWSEPRATTDIDLNLWIEENNLDHGIQVLSSAGAVVDAEKARSQVSSRGMFVGRLSGFRLDVFVPSIPFYDVALERRERVRLVGRNTWVLSAECLAVYKLLFFRAKDLVDLERLVEVQGPALDTGFVRHHVADMMGEDDERIVRWDTIVTRRETPALDT